MSASVAAESLVCAAHFQEGHPGTQTRICPVLVTPHFLLDNPTELRLPQFSNTECLGSARQIHSCLKRLELATGPESPHSRYIQCLRKEQQITELQRLGTNPGESQHKGLVHVRDNENSIHCDKTDWRHQPHSVPYMSVCEIISAP